MSLTGDQDRQDVARVLAGEVEAFAALVERHQGRLLAFLARLAGRDHAEDLAQEAFLRAYQALPRYDPAYPFRGWLLVIAGRLAANHHARRRERRLAEDADPPALDRAPEAEERERREADLSRLAAAVEELEPEARLLYELRYRHDLPLAAIAAQLAASEGAVKQRLLRLRRSLAAILGATITEED